MKTILWHQSPITGGKDTFIIDGIKREYSGTQNQDAAFNLLTDTDKYRKLNIRQCGSEVGTVSSDFHVFYNTATGETIVRSHFVDVDEIGRKIPYMFYSNQVESSLDLVNVLRNNAKLAGKKIKDGEAESIQQTLEEFSRCKKIQKTVVVVAAVTIMVAAAVLICK